MKTILLPFYDDDASQNAFELASGLARKNKAYVEGLFVMRRPQLFDSDSEVVTATKTGLQEQLLTSALTSKYGLISTVLKG